MTGWWLLWAGCAGTKGADSAAAPPVALSEEALVLTGGWADPSVLRDEAGWWLYLNRVEGEDAGTTALYSADGLDWGEPARTILPGVATARAVQMDGGVRLYYPEMDITGGYKSMMSAFSTDGISFEVEEGARWRSEEGDVGGPTLLAGPGGGWRAWFHVTSPGEEDPAVERAWIGVAFSEAGRAWTVEERPALEARADVEGVEPEAQALHPFALERDGLLWLFYNAHAALYAAVSEDGEAWTRLGALGVEGADLCAAEEDDGGLRAWFGRYTDVTGGEIWTARLSLDAEAARAALEGG